MALAPGTRLGPYEIVALLGSGGMGEVYRAREAKLGRDVALKVLPESLTADAEQIARFEREAQLLASLNHPNIAIVYGAEEIGSIRVLAMELVEGESLAARLRRGRLTWPEAVAVARQIAEAVRAAHDKGIIHRDLKPANVMVTPADQVKVLDFGLAKALDVDRPGLSTSASTTMSPSPTQVGTILGTPAYMSPEQAKGRATDKRSDVWAFGCVLFEMLAGARPFDGEDFTETIAAVVRAEPAWTALPPDVPEFLRALVRRCLEKDPKRRFHDLSVPLFLLEDRAESDQTRPGSSRSTWRRRAAILGAFGAGLVVAAAATWIWFMPPARPSTVTRFTIPIGDSSASTVQFTNLGHRVVAVSPDGRRVAYVADLQLWLRDLSESQSRRLPGGDIFQDISTPVFSPDGQWIAFWAQDGIRDELKRLPANGGTATSICAATDPGGMSWDGDTILFANAKGIWRVRAEGGTPELVVSPTPAEIAYGPHLLPDGTAVLFTVAPTANGLADWDAASIVVQRLGARDRTVLVKSGADGRLLSNGDLVYAVNGVLFAAPFDARRFALTGAPVSVVEGVARSTTVLTGAAQFSTSQNGTLVYIAGPKEAPRGRYELALVERDGQATTRLNVPPDAYEGPRVSPDGTRIVVGTDDANEATIWIYNLSGTTARRRLTFQGRNIGPVWTPDGARVTFQSDRGGDAGLYWQRADGTGDAERLTTTAAGTSQLPQAWSPDGRTLLFTEVKDGVSTLWMLHLPDRRIARVGHVQGLTIPMTAVYSPDGKWMAYSGDSNTPRGATGDPVIYVQPVPLTETTYQVASGLFPVWGPDEHELFFMERSPGLMASAVSLTPTFTFANPKALPQEGLRASGLRTNGPRGRRGFDFIPDGKRLVATVYVGASVEGPRGVQVIENWFQDLKGRLAGQ